MRCCLNHSPPPPPTLYLSNYSPAMCLAGGCRIAANSVAPMVAPKQQVQQVMNMECQDIFNQSPQMNLEFEYVFWSCHLGIAGGQKRQDWLRPSPLRWRGVWG